MANPPHDEDKTSRSEVSSEIAAELREVRTERLVSTFEEHRTYLLSIAYRMLGDRADSEDILQETFIRWQKASINEIANPRSFLVTVVTRLSINQLQSARVTREEYIGPWLPEPVLTAASMDPSTILGLDGSLSMAFLVLLERLSPMERAVLLLREVFDYEYSEIASVLCRSEANCRQLFRRAKLHITNGRPRFEVSQPEREELLQQFIKTSLSGDMQGLLLLLAKDAVLYTDGSGKATAVPNPIHGADAVARFLLGARQKLLPPDITRRFAEINSNPGMIAYHNGKVFGVLTLDVADRKIRNIYIVRNPDKLARLPNLPPAPY